jgi:hypothetical protein
MARPLLLPTLLGLVPRTERLDALVQVVQGTKSVRVFSS